MSKIMVVDDEPDVVLVLTGTLKKEGYEILGVNGGEECLSKLEKDSPDLILLDIMLPKMDGIAVLKKIKETSPDTAVVILTAYASLDSVIEAMRHEASYYLSKPYKSEELKLVIKNALEKRRLELELRESEQKYRSLVENANDAIFLVNPKDGRFLEANPKIEELTGYTRDELLGMSFFDVYPDRDTAMLGFQRVLEKGFAIFDSGLFLQKERSSIPVEFSANLLEFHKERVIQVIARDITERKKAEEKIKQLKEFNESIVEKMEEGILMEDAEGYITFANPKVEKMLGRSKDELVGKHWSKIVSKSYQKKVEKETKKRPTGMKSKYEAALISKDGKEIPVIVSATPLFEDGKFNGVLAVLTDITERKKAEEEMRTKMMKYRVERGSTYLVKEKRLEKGMDVLLDLLKCGYKGLIITRTRPEEIKKMCEVEVPIVWLSEKKYDEMTIPPESFLIEKTIENYLDRDRAVLLDRLDYLITKNGFKETLDFIQKLNEAFYIAKGILVISLDPAILDAQELSLLEKEFNEAKLKYEPSFPADLYEMLEFVREQNRIGKKPTHKDIESKFKITRTTARKRINKLKHEGIVEDSKWGKFKVLALTEKGKALF